jgi:hypothetical protein
MVPTRIRQLDIVSQVTILMFAVQVVLAAILAYLSPAGFQHSFALILSAFAAIQALLAANAEPAPSRHTLNEWDGVSWLVFLAMGFGML